MKLGKLLSAGRSFLYSKRTEYRLDKHFYLPKFNDGNPFTAKPSGERPPEILLLPDMPMAQARSYPPERLRPAVVVHITAPPQAKSAVKPAARSAKKSATGWGWNPFRPAPPAAPLPMLRATQPELSLHEVKVMHNDLADADVDVVPVRVRANAPVAQPQLSSGRRALEVLDEIIKSK